MKTYKAKAKQKKDGMDIKKVLILASIGTGIYLLFTRMARAEEVEEVPEEFTPAEKPQQQLDQQLFLGPPSTIIEKATEKANIEIQQVKEETNTKIQQIQAEAVKTIDEVRTKADEALAALQKQIESAYQLKQEDLIRVSRFRQREKRHI